MRHALGIGIATLVVAGFVTIAAIAAFVHVDFLPALGTYGVSVGTDTTYCSVDYPDGFSCQSEQSHHVVSV